MLYSRRQLALVLALVAAAGAGLAINRWRATHATGVERLERLDREPDVATGPVDVNHATVDELRTLPGIGVKLAARIVATRDSAGPFESIDDLRRVPGMGAAKLERLRPAVAVAP